MESVIEEKRIPKDFTDSGFVVMTNLDHTIDEKVSEEIKNKNLFAQYSGWNFCGYVWWENDKWYCEVWCYHNHQKTFSGETLQDIMDDVSSEYGNE